MNDKRPSRRFSSPREKPDPWWLTRFREHPYKYSSVAVLTIGGLMLLILFFHIRALPSLDLAGATTTLAAIAAVGLLVCVLFGGSVLVGGVTLRSAEFAFLRSFGYFVTLSAPGILLMVYMSLRWLGNNHWSSPSWLALLPFAGTIGIVSANVAWWVTTGPEGFEKSTHSSRWAVLRRWITILRGRFADCKQRKQLQQWLLQVPANAAEATDPWREAKARTVNLVIASCAWNAVGLMAFLTLLALIPKDESMNAFVGELIPWTIACYVINGGVANLPKANEVFAIILAGLAGIVLLLFITQNFSGIPSAAARVFGIGGDIPIRLVVTPQGCAIINSMAGGRDVCRIGPGGTVGQACPVLLRSRIGSPFFVALSPFDDFGGWPRIDAKLPFNSLPVPASEVLTWPRIVPLPGTTASAPAPQGLVAATWLDDRKLDTAQRRWLAQQCADVATAPASSPASASSAPPGMLAPAAANASRP